MSRIPFPTSRTSLRQLLAVSAVLGAAGLAAVSVEAAGGGSENTEGSAIRIYIDPGHGGSDPGAIGNAIVEKEINLDVALRLREQLEADTLDTFGGGTWEVRMSRTTDQTVSLSQRAIDANNWPADRFVSIHHNAFTSSLANGTETFSFSDGTISADLRDLVQEELILALGLTDRGGKTANFFVLRETNMPAVLSEGGFLTNPGDAAALSAPGAVDLLARAHLFGIQRSYGIAPYVPSDGPIAYCTAKVSSPGCVPSIGSTGTPSLSQSDFVVNCEDVVSQQFGLLFWGRQEIQLPLLGGTLCVGGTIRRTPVQFSFGLGNANCSGFLELPMDSAFMQSQGFAAGDDIYCQWWFRDPGLLPAAPVGLSNGLRFTVRP
ncbi:MAG: N-acetylmuramoyl-L-alanine amidase [Planctomycetota bacterium]